MPGSASASCTSRIARCRSSSGYFRSAAIVPCSWWLDRLHQTRCGTTRRSQEHQLRLVGGAPGADAGMAVRGEVVADDVELLVGPASAQDLEQIEELDRPLPWADPVEQLAGGQVECREH